MTDNDSAWGPGDNPEDFPTRASRRRAGKDPGTGPISEVPRFADRFSPPEEAPEQGPTVHAEAEEQTVRRPVLDIRFDESANSTSTWTTSVPVTFPTQTDGNGSRNGSRPPVTPVPSAEAESTTTAPDSTPGAPAETAESTTTTAPTSVPDAPSPTASVPGTPSVPPRSSRRPAAEPEGRRRSFLATDNGKVPAEAGFRGLLTKIGIRVPPSKRELIQRANTRAVSQHWPGPRTISVVNGKGGANKTPTTVMLAAVFARNGGGPVLAWDNNETRGTLGWRTEQGPHSSTVMDLLPQTGHLLSPSAQSALLARFVHHQIEDKYDVLRSKPDVLASEQKVTSDDFDALHEVASKYFRLNIVDSGNDETAERWLRMIHHTDQLVIATTTLEEHAEAGALLLEALRARGGKYAELSQNAVVIVSQSDKNGTAAQAQEIADGFGQLARRAVTIPYDVALLKGRIRWGALKPATQSAWLGAAAAVAEGL
ncbi:MinD-like ATPase involved in chromosome partitioning or flagellar assembly [Arthrobacter pigmenti]|uniref:MinD-like ATPase involved in chromosome partitioning or flagellar assembly n=1 Tax=Arthrobacter pigmenti TaxID=271432 RepID=A0A846RIV1_9MICC|nr:ATPase [Arthrobacter pigmenti]NJC23218.1 MinD-like ATPase involved in chromosome partitioning or flagellar assembly [Arthrobacter pigmenti]